MNTPTRITFAGRPAVDDRPDNAWRNPLPPTLCFSSCSMILPGCGSSVTFQAAGIGTLARLPKSDLGWVASTVSAGDNVNTVIGSMSSRGRVSIAELHIGATALACAWPTGDAKSACSKRLSLCAEATMDTPRGNNSRHAATTVAASIWSMR